MDKIVISPDELTEIQPEPSQAVRPEPKLPPAIAWWGRVAPIALVPLLPLLCLVTIILRVALRGQPPPSRNLKGVYRGVEQEACRVSAAGRLTTATATDRGVEGCYRANV